MVARGVPRTVSRSSVCPACGAVSEANERAGCGVGGIIKAAGCNIPVQTAYEEVLVFFDKRRLPLPEEALPGRSERMAVPEVHFVNGARLTEPFPDGLERAVFGMGCFWGA